MDYYFSSTSNGVRKKHASFGLDVEKKCLKKFESENEKPLAMVKKMKKIKDIRGNKMRKDIINYLIDFPLFDALKGNQLNIVADHMNYYEIDKGEILFKEGDKGDYICFVLDGVIDVLKKSVTGDSIVIAVLPKGRSFGEMSILDDFPRSATAKARTKSSFLTLTRRGFNSILKDYPQIGITILKGISRRLSQNLRQTSSRLADYILPIA